MLVEDLIAAPEHLLEVVVWGNPRRPVRWVHVGEMPDPAPYLEGDEVVLTSGLWYQPGAAWSFVERLVSARASALGFGVTASWPTIPEDVVESCGQLGLTLFRVPDEVPFIAIIKRFVDQYVEDHERPLRVSLQLNEQLVRASRSGRGHGAVLRVLRGQLPGPCAVVQGSRIVTAAGGKLSAQALSVVVAAEASGAQEPLQCDDAVAFPVIAAGRHGAWLVVSGRLNDLSLADRSSIDQALAFVAIELQRDVAVRESERRFAAELFDLVVGGDPLHPAVRARVTAFGLDPDSPLVVVVWDTPDPESEIEAVERFLDQEMPPTVAAIKGQSIVGVAQWLDPGRDLEEFASKARDALGPQSTVGVGSIAQDAQQLRVSLVEARHACRFASRRRDAGFAIHDHVASSAMLLAIQDDQVLQTFHQALIEPLIQHDLRRHTDLVRTLELFLAHAGGYQVTATQLNIHVNTLRRRLARIETLTGRDLTSMDDRVDFYIALRARRSPPTTEAESKRSGPSGAVAIEL